MFYKKNQDELCRRFPSLKSHYWERLLGGRTNLVWKVGDYVVKKVNKNNGNILFPNNPNNEIFALQNLGLHFAPKFIKSFEIEAYSYIIYEFFEGDMPSPAAPELAQILSHLHQYPSVTSIQQRDFKPVMLVEMAHSFLTMAKQDALLAYLSQKYDMQTKAQEYEARCDTSCEAVFLHGDPVPANAIKRADGRGILIDWQCCARGDPVHDLAITLSPGMNFLYAGCVPSAQESENFLEIYCQQNTQRYLQNHLKSVGRYRALKVFFHYLIWAYCLYQYDKGKIDYAEAATLEAAAFVDSHV